MAWTNVPTWWFVFITLVLTCAAVANSWLLYTGLRQKKLRESSFHILLRNHTLDNLILSVFLYPVLIYRMKSGLPANRGEQEMCSVSSLAMMWFVSIGFCTNVLTALNRAVSCHPTWAPGVKIRGKMFTYGALASVWICTFLVYLSTSLAEEKSWKGLFACSLVEDIIANYLSGGDPLFVDPMTTILISELSVSVFLSVVLSITCYVIIARFLLGSGGAATTSAQRR